MITRNSRSETGTRNDMATAGVGILKSVVSAYERWIARRQAIRQLYRLDRTAPRDLTVDQSEFNSIIFGDVADRRRDIARQ